MIIPIVVPSVDWHNFVNYSNQFLSRSPTRMLDQNSIAVGNLSSFVQSIGGFEYEHFDPNAFIENCEIELQHLQFVFLCKSNLLGKIQVYTNLVVSAASMDVFIMSGNLQQFKHAIVKKYNSADLRLFFNRLYSVFVLLGLGQIWQNYIKQENQDGTIEFKIYC